MHNIYNSFHKGMITFIMLILGICQSSHAINSNTHGSKMLLIAVAPISSLFLDRDAQESIASALSTEILNSGKVRVLEREQVERILKEQGFQQSGACDGSDCAVEMGKLLSVDAIIVSRIGKVGRTITVTSRLVNVNNGEIRKSVTKNIKGEVDDILTEVIPEISKDLISGIVNTPSPAVVAKKNIEPSATDSIQNNPFKDVPTFGWVPIIGVIAITIYFILR